MTASRNFSDLEKNERAILMICIGIALFFWFMIQLSKSYVVEEPVGLIYETPTDKSFSSIPVSFLNVKSSSIGWHLVSQIFKSEKEKAFIELEDQSQQVLNRNLLIAKVNNVLSSRKSIVDINPDFVIVQLENTAELKLPVLLKDSILFADGYHLKNNVQISPDSITISGPNSLISGLTNITTKPLKLKDVKTDQTLDLELEPINSELLTLNTTKVNIKLEVEEFSQKTINVQVIPINSPDSITVVPGQVAISFIAGLSHYNSITDSDFYVEVDCLNLRQDSTTKELPVIIKDAPEKAKNISVEPAFVEVFIVQQ